MLSEWLKLLKLKARYFFALLIVCCLFLFTSDDFAQATGIEEFRRDNRGWIGLVFFVSLALWVIGLCDWWLSKVRRSKWQVSIFRNLESLSSGEWFYVLYCLATNQRTVFTDLIDPDMQSLCQKGIFSRAGGPGNLLVWSYTIPDFVWEYLQQTSGLLYKKETLRSAGLLNAIRAHDERIRRNIPRL